MELGTSQWALWGWLLGFREETFVVGEWRKGFFHISALVYHRTKKCKWLFVLVYGPEDHGRSEEFLLELRGLVAGAQFPIVVGGDFNLIIGVEDKKNSNICWPRIHLFNNAIADMALREIR